jgi:hypothetical protein
MLTIHAIIRRAHASNATSWSFHASAMLLQDFTGGITL